MAHLSFRYPDSKGPVNVDMSLYLLYPEAAEKGGDASSAAAILILVHLPAAAL
jgi:hypothetical protein